MRSAVPEVAASSNATVKPSDNICPCNAGEDTENSGYAAATDSTASPTLTPFRAFSKAKAISSKPSIATEARIPSRLPKCAYKIGWPQEISSDSRRTVTFDHPSSHRVPRIGSLRKSRHNPKACLQRSANRGRSNDNLVFACREIPCLVRLVEDLQYPRIDWDGDTLRLAGREHNPLPSNQAFEALV